MILILLSKVQTVTIFLYHKKQQGQNRAILSPWAIYNNLVYDQNEEDENKKENQNNKIEVKKMNHWKDISHS
jgi:hypothetical protein